MPELRDPESLRGQLTAWIQDRVRESRLRGAIFGLSGGVDSSVVCGLAAEALGPERCLGMVLPIESSPEDARLASRVAERFGVQTIAVDLEQSFLTLLDALVPHQERALRVGGGSGAAEESATEEPGGAAALARANLKPRLRMTSLYYFANLLGYLVLGTGNKDEFTVGYFTKWGDGAADAFPLGDLVKREVCDLGRLLGVPEDVIERPPTAGLWAEQTDEADLGMTYAQLDRYLLAGSSGDAALDAEIERRARAARHKVGVAPVGKPI